jgi:type II secretory pathway pseudopilin PulG
MTGLTLIELSVVLLILLALASVLVPMFSGTGRYAQCVATDTTLANIREVIMGNGGQAGYWNDLGKMPDTRLHELFNQTPGTPSFNPVTQRGWRGPYLSSGATCESLAGQFGRTELDLANVGGTLQATCKFSKTAAGQWRSGRPHQTLALDSFNLIGPNGALPFRSPILLCTDLENHYYLLSSGPDGMSNLIDQNGLCRQRNPTTANRRDDRVLYLDSYDSGGNQSCSE